MFSALHLFQITLIDLSLAGDNALVVGSVVSGLPPEKRKHTMVMSIAAATGLRILMALFAVQLLQLTGLMTAGGLLLLWVGWKMIRELHARKNSTAKEGPHLRQNFVTALWHIIVADVSMSLDNTLAVAGVARNDMSELIVGLCLSVALMGLVSSKIAQLTTRFPKLGYIGVAIILYTSLHMIYEGGKLSWMPTHAFV